MTVWTSRTAAAATGGQARGDWSARGVSIDTRTLQTGDLFVALKDVRDGHEFVAQALEKGAAAALVSRIPEGLEGAPLLLVPDVLRALEDMARAARGRAKRLVAVTGSVGKTGTKEMLRVALAPQGSVHAAEKSYNNHWGVPLTLARMPEGTDFAVIEIGMNHPGEIAPLSRLARPDVAVVTNVAAVHMAAFESLEAIAEEKASIVEGVSGGVAVLNGDGDMADVLAGIALGEGVEVVRFGEGAGNDLRLLAARVGDGFTDVRAGVSGATLEFRIGGAGRHFAVNALAVLGAVQAAGADVARAAAALADWHPPAGRGERWQVGDLLLIDDSYNANPLSMGVALAALAAGKGRKVAILGDMLELGAAELDMHRALAQHPAMTAIDTVHCVGPRMKALFEALPVEKRGERVTDSAELQGRIGALLQGGDTVMVKGSLGAKTGILVDAIKNLGDARALDKSGES